ncbi:MAG TPA: hypothetical protein VGP72_22135 [Planctomycetota bacterium]
MPRGKPREGALSFVSTDELMGELKRRSLGCLIVCVRAEERGDAWRYSLRGSPVLLGAMSAALSMEIQRSLGREGENVGSRA